MSRYIDADKTLEDIRNLAEKHHMNGEYWFANGILKAITRVKSQPPADVKEVVMCKDCKWFDGKHIKHNDGHIEYVSEDYPFVTNSIGVNFQARCMRIPYIDNLFVKDNGTDYCSRGESKEALYNFYPGCDADMREVEENE